MQGRLHENFWPSSDESCDKMLQWGPHPSHIARSVRFELRGGNVMNMNVFPNLECVETGAAIFLQGPQFAFLGPKPCFSCEWTVRRHSPKTIDVFVAVADAMDAWVTRIELTKLREVLLSREKFEYPPVVPKLAHLIIDLSETDCWDEDSKRTTDFEASSVLASWLEHLTGLRSLVIRQNPRLTPALDILAMIWISPEPPDVLNTVELDHATFHGDSLCSFVKQHRKSLEQVIIRNPVIAERDWQKTQTWLTEESSAGYTLQMNREPYKPDNVSRERWERNFRDKHWLVPYHPILNAF
ncbi:MAG: hypothetical protein Q9191_006096 [Dirinaria sp. TL-2023a]